MEAAVARWRYQGWVALEVPSDAGQSATVVSRPVIPPAHTKVTLNVELSPSACATVSLLRLEAGSTTSLLPIDRYSGRHAARICEDSIAARVAWAGKTALPEAEPAVVFEISLPARARLFGLTFVA